MENFDFFSKIVRSSGLIVPDACFGSVLVAACVSRRATAKSLAPGGLGEKIMKSFPAFFPGGAASASRGASCPAVNPCVQEGFAMDDSEFVKRAIEGDGEAFGELVKRWQDPVAGWLPSAAFIPLTCPTSSKTLLSKLPIS